RMERESFNHPSVLGQASGRFVAVKLRSDVHEELAVGYGLSALPATVILRPTGGGGAAPPGLPAPAPPPRPPRPRRPPGGAPHGSGRLPAGTHGRSGTGRAYAVPPRLLPGEPR